MTDLIDDELLMARDPDGGSGRSVPEPDEQAASTLHHMAVVVKDLDRAVRLFKALGHVEEATSFLSGVKNVVMASSSGVRVVLQSPVSRHSELVDYLAAHGAGVQHIGFETESLEQVQKLLDGLVVWEREPVVHPGLRVLCSEPDPTTGLVFELLERRPEDRVRPFPEAAMKDL